MAATAAAVDDVVEGAPRAAPYPAAGADGHVEGPRLAWIELHAAADRGRRRPHREAEVVGDPEGGSASPGGEAKEEEEETINRGRHG